MLNNQKRCIFALQNQINELPDGKKNQETEENKNTQRGNRHPHIQYRWHSCSRSFAALARRVTDSVLGICRSVWNGVGYSPQFLPLPADGKIVVIEEVEENRYFHDRRLMISIFMSLFNVHANWFPVDGKVKFVKHRDGNFHKAWLPKASEENEHADVMITTPEGEDILCRQIAGAMARRIVTYAKEGEECFIDEHMGFIKLGSRVDVFLPLGSEVCVKMGQATTGDLTVLAKLP